MPMKPENLESFEVDKTGYSATNGGGVVYSESDDANGVTDVLFVKKTTEISQGPLPPPRILKEYDEIIPNGAERIMRMAEKEQDSRLEVKRLNDESNRKLMKRKLDYFKRGQWMGFSLALIVLISAGLFAYFNFVTLAGILLTTTLVALVGLFVYTTKNQNKV